MPKTLDKVLSRRGVAMLLDVSMKTIDRWTKEHFIPHIRLRGRVLYSKKKILKWLEGFEIAGKDWKAELKNTALFISKAEANRRIERKKKLRKLYRKLRDLLIEAEAKSILTISKRWGDEKKREMMIYKISSIGHQICKLLGEESLSLFREQYDVRTNCIKGRPRKSEEDKMLEREQKKPNEYNRLKMIERGLIKDKRGGYY